MDEDAERYAVIAAALAGHAPLADAIRALRSAPAGGPYRGALAAGLIDRFVDDEQSQLFGERESLEALIAIGDGDPPAGPSWPRTRALGRSAALAMAAMRYDLPDTESALEELDDLAAVITAGDRVGRIHLERARLAVSMYHAVIDGDDPFQSEAWQRFRKLADGGPPEAVALGEAIDISQALMNDPHTDLDARLERLGEVAARLPDSAARSMIETTADQIRQVIAGNPDAIPSTGGGGAGALHLAASVIGPLSAEDATAEDLDRAVDRLRAALAACPDDPHQRILHLTGLAGALARRAQVRNDIGDLPEAERLLVEAQGLLSGPQDRAWEIVHEGLSQVRQRMGGEQDSYLDAVVSLRTHVWRVLMQPDAAGAAAVAREAGEAAVSAARGCLRVHDVAGAVRALDAGRGLALYAATEMRSVPDLLRGAGRDDLAADWQRAIDADGPAPGLRRRVFGVLADIAPGGALFDPPEIDEIREALSELDLDGLVYLVPSSDLWPGLAVTVPAVGELSYLGLPGLKPADSPEVAAYLGVASRRDSAAVGRSGKRDMVILDDDLTDRLDIVRDWAWRAAMGPILDSVLPTWTHVPAHRVPRMALVPMGELALIPWQAARRAGGEPAIRSVAFSQAASARMLLRSAALPPVAPSRLGLIVADPETGAGAVDLHGAREEASAIHDAFYRGARYLGRLPGDDGEVSPSGEGTPEQVRAWLTSTGRAAGSMLHLACHGVADSHEGGSHLMLAGQRLAAEELVKLMTAVPDRAVGLVVLAACSSGMAARDYDEAYSLGTAFLAGGARSVLSTQWTIPDSSTSLLMFMFHHHLMTDRLPVWEALHRAQLWMLDPDREVPASMPARLSAQLDDGDPADVTGWAGFLHGGR
ncbi:CHAT domain-containing protein [Actinoplanes flavus]|uniref:CHAT domain-containing protein n=1 Tax=Actinoplanes flavus TaxID=2820290 RepID=A0ABS3UGB8_9ACTN|nr:CHAT domain-containing protein [Actinoplanes flavus]MBO3737824.1 CHAT domain-containing protein [Actinoplanes flavus]